MQFAKFRFQLSVALCAVQRFRNGRFANRGKINKIFRRNKNISPNTLTRSDYEKTENIYLVDNCFWIIDAFGVQKMDVSEYTTVIAMGIDKSEKGVKVSAQAVNDYVLGSKPTQSSPVVIFSERRNSLRRLSETGQFSVNRLFIFHIQCLVIGAELAQGIEEYIEFCPLLGDAHNFNVVVAHDEKAEDVLKMRSLLHNIPAVAVESKLENFEKIYGVSKITFIDEIVTALKLPNICLTLSSIAIVGDKEKGKDNEATQTTDPEMRLKASTIAVFKNDKMLGWLSEEESLGFRHIYDKIEKTVLHIEHNNKLIYVEVKNTSCKMSFKLEKGELTIILKHKMNVTVPVEIAPNEMNQIRDKINEDLRRLMDLAIFTAQNKYNADIFGFCETIHQTNPEYYQSIKDRYDTVFPTIKVRYQFETTIDRTRSK